MAYSKQTWDTTSYVNPTRMNHIEQGIYDAQTTADNASTKINGLISTNVNASNFTYEQATGCYISNQTAGAYVNNKTILGAFVYCDRYDTVSSLTFAGSGVIVVSILYRDGSPYTGTFNVYLLAI